jgi:hypothetical protein
LRGWIYVRSSDWLNEIIKKKERSVTTLLIIETFNKDMKEVVLKWTEKIMAKNILELDETRLKMDFMILRSKLDFIYKLDFLDNFDLLMTKIDTLENDLIKQFEKAVRNIFVDKVVEALKKPLIK